MGRTKRDNLISVLNRPIIPKNKFVGGTHMTTNRVVLYFDEQEDALLFTLAASSAMSAEGPLHSGDVAVKVAEELCKASRITTEGVLNVA